MLSLELLSCEPKNYCMKLLFALFIGFAAFGQINVHLEDFNSGIGSWIAVENGDASNQWTSTSNMMQIDGVVVGADDDWLISPAIDLDAQEDEHFLFDYKDVNTGLLLELYYSIDYNGGGTAGDVNAANWTNIPLSLLDLETIPCFTTTLQRHPAIDISAINGTSVYFAFKAQATGGVGKQYQIDNVHIEAEYYGSVLSFINSGGGCEALKTEIHDVIVNQSKVQYTSTTYDLWDAILHTDKKLNDAGNAFIVWDMFTDVPSGADVYEFDHCNDRDAGSCPGGEGQCYNREHTFPQSWWGGGQTAADTQRVDIHHVVPSDRSLNTSKSNNPPGIVTTAVTTGSNGFKVGFNPSYPCSSAMYYEPIDEYKGDYARMYLYVGTRYEHNMVLWSTISTEGDCAMSGDPYTCYEPWLLNLLLEWHNADPVSSKEIDRNNAIYAIQGNRNPYIDNPNWVTLIWGDGTNPCDVGLDELNNSEKELVKMVDLMGRETKFTPNTPLIYIYSDGTTERVFKLEE